MRAAERETEKERKRERKGGSLSKTSRRASERAQEASTMPQGNFRKSKQMHAAPFGGERPQVGTYYLRNSFTEVKLGCRNTLLIISLSRYSLSENGFSLAPIQSF